MRLAILACISIVVHNLNLDKTENLSFSYFCLLVGFLLALAQDIKELLP